jgi:hypothetical protein
MHEANELLFRTRDLCGPRRVLCLLTLDAKAVRVYRKLQLSLEVYGAVATVEGAMQHDSRELRAHDDCL